MINTFIQRHESPICLVAHNGANYDFRLLKAEFNSVGKELPAGILCADSMVLFKDLDERSAPVDSTTGLRDNEGYSTPTKSNDVRASLPVKRKLFPMEESECSTQCQTEEKPDKCAKLPTKALMKARDEDVVNTSAKTDNTPVASVARNLWDDFKSGQSLEDDLLSGLDIPEDNSNTQACSTSAEGNTLCNVSTKLQVSHTQDDDPNSKNPEAHGKPTNSRQTDSTPANEMAESRQNVNVLIPPRISYKLSEVHKRIVGHRPRSVHSAEDDALAIARIFHKISGVVCRWVEENAERYEDVEPMYSNNSNRTPLPKGSYPYNYPVRTNKPADFRMS